MAVRLAVSALGPRVGIADVAAAADGVSLVVSVGSEGNVVVTATAGLIRVKSIEDVRTKTARMVEALAISPTTTNTNILQPLRSVVCAPASIFVGGRCASIILNCTKSAPRER